jgi:hypothetical protein
MIGVALARGRQLLPLNGIRHPAVGRARRGRIPAAVAVSRTAARVGSGAGTGYEDVWYGETYLEP